MNHLIPLLVIGLATGVLSGLLGVGGGLVLVPALLFLLHGLVPDSVLMKSALATSLAVIVFSGSWAAWLQAKAGNFDARMAALLSGGAAVGALIGSMLTAFAPETFLKVFFIVFVIYVAAQMLWPKMPKFGFAFTPKTATVAGFVVGTISSLVGVAGGTLLVPYLTMCNVDMKKAIGVATAVGVSLAAAASVGYYLSARSAGVDIAGSLGYVKLDVLAALVATCMAGSIVGVSLNKRVNAAMLKKIFAVLLLGTAIKMIASLV